MQALDQNTFVARASLLGLVRSGTDWCAPAELSLGRVDGLDLIRAARLVPVSRYLVRVLTTYGVPVALLIDEQGVWPSSEDWLPPTLLRERGGCGTLSGDFASHPGTLFATHEQSELASMIAGCFSAGLGFVAVDANGCSAVRINHDGNGWLAGRDAQQISECVAFLTTVSN